MAVFLIRGSANKLLRTELFRKSFQIAKISDHERQIIGKREIVGFGFNGQPVYFDRPDFPFPAIRWKESTSEIEAMREKEKGDWNQLSCEEKKALYRLNLLTKDEKRRYILKYFTKECKIVLQDFRIAKGKERTVLNSAKRKKYSCYTCLKKFFTNSDLELHKSVHINISKSKKVPARKQPARIVNKETQLLSEEKASAVTSEEDIASTFVTHDNNPKLTSSLIPVVKEEVSLENSSEKVTKNLFTFKGKHSSDPEIVTEKLSKFEGEHATYPQESAKNGPTNFKYMCSLCIAYFNDVSDIKAHNHIALKCKYYCKKCSRNFTIKNGFVVHALQHDITESKKHEFTTLTENKPSKSYVSNNYLRVSCGPLQVPIERTFSAPKKSTLNCTEECVTSYICSVCYGVFQSLEMLNKHNSSHELAKEPKTITIQEQDIVNLEVDIDSLTEIKEEKHAPINPIYEEAIAEEDDIFIEDYDKYPNNLNEKCKAMKNQNLCNDSIDAEGENQEEQWSQMINNVAISKNKHDDSTCNEASTSTIPIIAEDIPSISIPEISDSSTHIPFSQIDEIGSTSFGTQMSLLKKYNSTELAITNPSGILSNSTSPHYLRLENQKLTLNSGRTMTRVSLKNEKTPPNSTSKKRILYDSIDAEGENQEEQWSQMLNNVAISENKHDDSTCNKASTSTIPIIAEDIPTISIPEISDSTTHIPFSQIDEIGSTSFGTQMSLLKKYNSTELAITNPSGILSNSTSPHYLRLENQILTLNSGSTTKRVSLKNEKTPLNSTSKKRILYRVIKIPRPANVQVSASRSNRSLLKPALNPNHALPSTNEVLNPPTQLLVNKTIMDYKPNSSDGIIPNRETEDTSQKVTECQKESSSTIEDVDQSINNSLVSDLGDSRLRRILLGKGHVTSLALMNLGNSEIVSTDHSNSSARCRGGLNPEPLISVGSNIILPKITNVRTVVEDHTDHNKTKVSSRYEHEFTKFLDHVNNSKNNKHKPPKQLSRSSNSEYQSKNVCVKQYVNRASHTVIDEHTYSNSGNVPEFKSVTTLKAFPIDYVHPKHFTIDKNIERQSIKSSVEIGNISLMQRIPQIDSFNCLKPIIHGESSKEGEGEALSTALGKTSNSFKEQSLVIDTNAVRQKFMFHLMTEKAKKDFIRRHFSNECTVVLTDVQKSLDFNNIIFRQPAKAIVDKNYTCIIYSDKLVNKNDFEPVKYKDNDSDKAITDTANQSLTSEETNVLSTKLMGLRSNQKDPSHRCLGCRVIFNDLSDVQNHLHIIHSCKYICKHCGKQFKNKHFFADHVMDHLITNKPNNSSSTTPNIQNSNSAYDSFDNDSMKSAAGEKSSHVKNSTDMKLTKDKHNFTKKGHKSTSVKRVTKVNKRVTNVNKKRNLSTNCNDLFKSIPNLTTSSATDLINNPLTLSNANIKSICVDSNNLTNNSQIVNINKDSHMIANKNSNCSDTGIINDFNCSPNAETSNLIINYALPVLSETTQTDTVHSSHSYIEYYSHDFPIGCRFSAIPPDQIFDCDMCPKRFASKIAIDQHKIWHVSCDHTVDTKKCELHDIARIVSEDPKLTSQPVKSSLLPLHRSNQTRKEKKMKQLKESDKKNILHPMVNQNDPICEIQSSEPMNIKNEFPQSIFGSEAPNGKSSATQMENILVQPYIMMEKSNESTAVVYEQGNLLSDNYSAVPHQRRKLVPIKPKLKYGGVTTEGVVIRNVRNNTLLTPGINVNVEDSRKHISKIYGQDDISTNETIGFNFLTKSSESIAVNTTTSAISSNSNTCKNDHQSSASTVKNNCIEMKAHIISKKLQTNKNASNVKSKINILKMRSRLSDKSRINKIQDNKGSDVIGEKQNIQLNTSDGVILLRSTDLTNNTQLISSLPAKDLNEGCMILTSQDWMNMTAAQNPIYYASDFQLAVPPLRKLSPAKNKNDETHIKKEYTETSDPTSLIKITKNDGMVTTCHENTVPINKIKHLIIAQPTAVSCNGSSVSIPTGIPADKHLISPNNNTSLVQNTNLPKLFSAKSNKADSIEDINELDPKSSITPDMPLVLGGTKVSSQNAPSSGISNILLPLDRLQGNNGNPLQQEEQNKKIKESNGIPALHPMETKNLQCNIQSSTFAPTEILRSESHIVGSSIQEQILSLPSTHSASTKFTEAMLEKHSKGKTALYKESLKKKIFNDLTFPVTNDNATNCVFYNIYKKRAEQLKKENDFLDITGYLEEIEKRFKPDQHIANHEHVNTSEFILPLITNVCTVTDNEGLTETIHEVVSPQVPVTPLIPNVCTVTDTEGLKENIHEAVAPQVPLINECIQDNQNKHGTNNHCKTALILNTEKLGTAQTPQEKARQILSSQLHLLNSWKENYLNKLEAVNKIDLSLNTNNRPVTPKKAVFKNKDVDSNGVLASGSGMTLPIISSVFTVTDDSITELPDLKPTIAITQKSGLPMALDINDDANSLWLHLQTNKDMIQNNLERTGKIPLSTTIRLSEKATSNSPNCNKTVTENKAVTKSNPEIKGNLETNLHRNLLITGINESSPEGTFLQYRSSDKTNLPCTADQRSQIDSKYLRSLQPVINVDTIRKNAQKKNVHLSSSRVQPSPYTVDQIFLINEKWPNEDDDSPHEG